MKFRFYSIEIIAKTESLFTKTYFLLVKRYEYVYERTYVFIYLPDHIALYY